MKNFIACNLYDSRSTHADYSALKPRSYCHSTPQVEVITRLRRRTHEKGVRQESKMHPRNFEKNAKNLHQRGEHNRCINHTSFSHDSPFVKRCRTRIQCRPLFFVRLARFIQHLAQLLPPDTEKQRVLISRSASRREEKCIFFVFDPFVAHRIPCFSVSSAALLLEVDLVSVSRGRGRLFIGCCIFNNVSKLQRSNFISI